MKPSIAATVTLDDLKTYFKGEHWRTTVRDDGTLEGRSNSYLIEISPNGSPSFAVKIYSYDDDQDADEAVTDEPLQFIVDFLKTGTAGDEVLQKMASAFRFSSMPPDGFAKCLRSWANDVEARKVGPRALSRILRRASLFPDFEEHTSILRTILKIAAREEVESKEMQDLSDKMTKKGWRVKTGKNDVGLPELTVDVAGVYEAKIEIDHIPWNYFFEVHDHPETKLEGVTDDPIVEFRNYYHSDVVQTAKAELKEGHKEKAEKAVDEGTVAPKSKQKKPPAEPYESGGA